MNKTKNGVRQDTWHQRKNGGFSVSLGKVNIAQHSKGGVFYSSFYGNNGKKITRSLKTHDKVTAKKLGLEMESKLLSETKNGNGIKQDIPKEKSNDLVRRNISDEAIRIVKVFDSVTGKRIPYEIQNPQFLYYYNGASTMRISDNKGEVHLVPAPGYRGAVHTIAMKKPGQITF